MNSKHLTINTALVFIFAGAVGAAETKSTKFHCTSSGTFTDVETNIDTNDDGVSASLDQGIVNCNRFGGLFSRKRRNGFLARRLRVPRGRMNSISVNPLDNSVALAQTRRRGTKFY